MFIRDNGSTAFQMGAGNVLMQMAQCTMENGVIISLMEEGMNDMRMGVLIEEILRVE